MQILRGKKSQKSMNIDYNLKNLVKEPKKKKTKTKYKEIKKCHKETLVKLKSRM